jgi:hypothetical protein
MLASFTEAPLSSSDVACALLSHVSEALAFRVIALTSCLSLHIC